MQLRRLGWVLAVFFILCAAPAFGDAKPDTAGVDELVKKYMAVWNAYDAKAYGDILTADATWVSLRGGYKQGRQQLVEARGHAQAQFEGKIGFTADKVETAFLKPDVALIFIQYSGRGDEPVAGVVSLVAVKQGDAWRIRSGQNVKKE